MGGRCTADAMPQQGVFQPSQRSYVERGDPALEGVTQGLEDEDPAEDWTALWIVTWPLHTHALDNQRNSLAPGLWSAQLLHSSCVNKSGYRRTRPVGWPCALGKGHLPTGKQAPTLRLLSVTRAYTTLDALHALHALTCVFPLRSSRLRPPCWWPMGSRPVPFPFLSVLPPGRSPFGGPARTWPNCRSTWRGAGRYPL